jgi:hypothetical protein
MAVTRSRDKECASLTDILFQLSLAYLELPDVKQASMFSLSWRGSAGRERADKLYKSVLVVLDDNETEVDQKYIQLLEAAYEILTDRPGLLADMIANELITGEYSYPLYVTEQDENVWITSSNNEKEHLINSLSSEVFTGISERKDIPTKIDGGLRVVDRVCLARQVIEEIISPRQAPVVGAG